MNLVNDVVTFPNGGPNRYWIGGSGDWNDNTHWSETSGGVGGTTIPSHSNPVIIDDNSIKEDEEKLIITWTDTVYCGSLTTTITTPCVFDAIATINITDGVTLSDTTTLVDTVSVSNIDTTVNWKIIDGDWIYMDTYYYTKTEWYNTTPEQLQTRQIDQYNAWRIYCENAIVNPSLDIETPIPYDISKINLELYPEYLDPINFTNLQMSNTYINGAF